jgi:hypothetical protein
MPFHHELMVYQRALEFATWSQDLIESLTKKTSTRDHLERAGDSIDRARFFQIAHGSALESGACLDLLVARRCCVSSAISNGKSILEEIVKMLFAMLDKLGCRIAEAPTEYGERIEAEAAVEED